MGGIGEVGGVGFGLRRLNKASRITSIPFAVQTKPEIGD